MQINVVPHVIVHNHSLTVAAQNQHFRAARVSKRYLGQDTKRPLLRSLLAALAAGWIAAASSACSVKHIAVNKLGNALAGSGTTFTSDQDPELVREALPFSLKLMESLLAESPRHRGLLLAAASGFTPYAYAFVQQEADEAESRDLEKATALRTRARQLYLRARDYGLRGLEVSHRGFGGELRRDARAAVRAARKKDVPLLYWTAASWGAAISLSKQAPDAVADQPMVEALIDRALALDESYGDGAIHSFLITYEASRNGAEGDFAVRSRKHFDRAIELSGGYQAAPLVSLAETVCVQKQRRAEFEALLQRAVALDLNAKPEFRLANLIMQRRARWLLGRADELFLEEAQP
jgi:predicted anti-sigma-YlaC factor YlaD